MVDLLRPIREYLSRLAKYTRWFFGWPVRHATPGADSHSLEAQFAEMALPDPYLGQGVKQGYCLARRHFCRSTVFAVAWSVPASNEARPSRPANPAWSKLK